MLWNEPNSGQLPGPKCDALDSLDLPNIDQMRPAAVDNLTVAAGCNAAIGPQSRAAEQPSKAGRIDQHVPRYDDVSASSTHPIRGFRTAAPALAGQ